MSSSVVKSIKFLTCPAVGKVEEIQHRVEEFISCTHEEEEWPGSVVEAKQGILLLTDILVRCLAQNIGCVEVNW